MNTELELLKRIDERNYLTEREHREFYGIVEKALINAKDIKEENTRYKNLEEQLGCPLEVYIKATRDGIWYSIAGNMKHCFIDVINASKIVFAMKGTNIWYKLKNYKKTWWLKENKEE